MLDLNKLCKKTFFTVDDIANVYDINMDYARVIASRYTKKGIFKKIKKNIYVLSFRWQTLGIEDLFRISTFLRVPSYISLTTALSYYGVTTQMQQNTLESLTTKITKRYEVDNVIFSFYKVKEMYFTNYEKMNGFFIAKPEKAYLDAVYLYSFGKYSFDSDAIDYQKLEKMSVIKIAENFPGKVKKNAEKLWKS